MTNKIFNDETIKAVWNKGNVVYATDPNVWRKDKSGAWINYNQYGNRDSDYGWEIDHIVPESQGGSDYLGNLQPLQWENNCTKGDDYPHYCTSVSSEGNKNIKKRICY